MVPHNKIRLLTFGQLDLIGREGESITDVLNQPKRSALLTILALAEAGRGRTRDKLIDLLWGDPDSRTDPRGSLSAALSFLRKRLGEDAIYESKGRLHLDRDLIWCDATVFREEMGAGRLDEAVERYRGEFLSDINDLPHCGPQFGAWLVAERFRLWELQYRALLQLATRRDAEQDLAGSALYWRRLWDHSRTGRASPDEDAACRAIDALATLGRRGEALVFAETCVEACAEAGIPPQQIRQRIEALKLSPPVPVSVSPGDPAVQPFPKPRRPAEPPPAVVALPAPNQAPSLPSAAGSEAEGPGARGGSRPAAADPGHERRDATSRPAAGPVVEPLPPPQGAAAGLPVSTERNGSDRDRGSLPVPATPFVGRAREIEEVRGLLASARLLTLTGPGGIGKTRLALKVAERIQEQCPDGAFFISLADIGEPHLVCFTIAHVFGLQKISGPDAEAAIAAHIGRKRLLLLLDNFEHVAESAPVVARLLSACPGLRVLVTSRAALRLQGEQEFPVPPLHVSRQRARPHPHHLSDDAAVQLFALRARAVQPSFSITEENAAAVVEICHGLDGLPLAIELAAARVKVLPPEAIRDRLDDRFSLLTGGALDLPDRQRTLRATMAWSYDLLSAGEKQLFRRLAVFRGGFTLEAAGAVVDPDGESPLDVLDGVASLVDKSLLRQANRGREPRFSMLETVREFALECLREHGERQAIRRQHAEFFLSLVRESEPDLLGPKQVLLLDRLDSEHDNIRAAIVFFRELGPQEHLLRMLAGLYFFWVFRSHVSEGWERIAAVLSRRTPGEWPQQLEASVLAGAGMLAYFMGDIGHAGGLCREALPLCRARNDSRLVSICLCVLGALAYFQEDTGATRELWEESERISRREEDIWLTSISLSLLGLAALQRGETQEALGMCSEALSLARPTGEGWAINQALFNLGLAQVAAGNLSAAHTHVWEAVLVCREMGYALGIAFSIDALGMLEHARGSSARATVLFGAAEAIRDGVRAPMAPAYRPMYQASLAAVRERLGTEAFRVEWSKGKALSLEQALDLALGVDDRKVESPLRRALSA